MDSGAPHWAAFSPALIAICLALLVSVPSSLIRSMGEQERVMGPVRTALQQPRALLWC